MVRIQKVIPLFTITFYKESNGMGIFFHKCVFKKTLFFPGLRIQVKMQIFNFFLFGSLYLPFFLPKIKKSHVVSLINFEIKSELDIFTSFCLTTVFWYTAVFGIASLLVAFIVDIDDIFINYSYKEA